MEIYKKPLTIKLKYPHKEFTESFVQYFDDPIIYDNTKHISNIIGNVVYSNYIKYKHLQLLYRICSMYPL